MNYPDLVNASFELFGAVFVLNHCRAVIRDKAVAGVSIASVAFFTLWGFWNVYFYPSLGQWFSFAGGLAICAANIFWIALLLKYRKVREPKAPYADSIRDLYEWTDDFLNVSTIPRT